MLEEHQRYYVLSRLYQQRKLSQKVLETWRKMIEGIWPDDDFRNGEQRMKTYLLKLRDQNLVWEYGVWLLERNPSIGLEALTGGARRSAPFTKSRILAQLKNSSGPALILYLEHLKANDPNADVYNELCAKYIEQMSSSFTSSSQVQETFSRIVREFRNLQSTQKTHFEVYLNPQGLLDGSTNSDEQLFWETRIKLMRSLQEPYAFDTERILKLIEHADEAKAYALEERVILYGRLERHVDALNVLTKDLHDFVGAEMYCFYGGTNPQTSTPSSVLFKLLLDSYLALLTEAGDDGIRQTLNLLNSQSRNFDLTTTLDRLPESWSVRQVSHFLQSAIRTSLHSKRESLVLKALCRQLNTATSARLASFSLDHYTQIRKA